MYIYYQTSAHIIETSAKAVCPTGTHYDLPANGIFNPTPYFIAIPIDCPCGGGSSGGGGGGFDEDLPPE
jgi:hypothetical protein